MMNPELSPEKQLNEAVAEAAAKDLFLGFAKKLDLSLTRDIWELPREEIVAARVRAAARGLGVDEVFEEFPENTPTVQEAKIVVDLIFSDLMEQPLPRKILAVKSGEALDHRDELIPVVPDMFQEQLKQDFINYQNGWNNPNAFDIEL